MNRSKQIFKKLITGETIINQLACRYLEEIDKTHRWEKVDIMISLVSRNNIMREKALFEEFNKIQNLVNTFK